MTRYKVDDIVELTRLVHACMSYIPYTKDGRHPVGTQFVIVKAGSPFKYGLKLLIDGKPIDQTGRPDGAFVGVSSTNYKLVEPESRTNKMLKAIR